jgi:hypothetical protein
LSIVSGVVVIVKAMIGPRAGLSSLVEATRLSTVVEESWL